MRPMFKNKERRNRQKGTLKFLRSRIKNHRGTNHIRTISSDVWDSGLSCTKKGSFIGEKKKNERLVFCIREKGLIFGL